MVTQTLAPAAIPPGERVYAVGDVHGCLDELAALHAAIVADLAARPVGQATVVHLGDYIDRGPDSAGVIARLMAGPIPAARVINLMGNHEDMLLDALDGVRGMGGTWMQNGGVASLSSWRVPPRAGPREWSRLIPEAHVAFMRSLQLTHLQGGYMFVHAGVRPGVAMAAQTKEDMLWIREPFLSHAQAHPFVVVHGHTPEEGHPVVRTNRIGLDTGAVMGGPLTCAVLEADRLGFIQI
jgi:serine/threonine protein phosphatase 1